MVGGFPHFGDTGIDHFRQALATEFRFASQCRPAVFGKLLIGFLEALGHGHGLVVPFGTFLVARDVQRRQHAFGELGRLFHDRVDHVGRCVLATRHLRYLLEPCQLFEHELHVANRCNVFTHFSVLLLVWFGLV